MLFIILVPDISAKCCEKWQITRLGQSFLTLGVKYRKFRNLSKKRKNVSYRDLGPTSEILVNKAMSEEVVSYHLEFLNFNIFMTPLMN